MALPMCVADRTDNMEPEKSDGHSVEDNHPPHHPQIGGLIVIMILFHPKAWLFQAFLAAPTDLSKLTVVAKQGKDPMWR